jgi:hypothetical protein
LFATCYDNITLTVFGEVGCAIFFRNPILAHRVTFLKKMSKHPEFRGGGVSFFAEITTNAEKRKTAENKGFAHSIAL